MNVSWNGRYNPDGDPKPDNNYLPCGKPVVAAVEGRHYCDTHALATGNVRLVVDNPVKNNGEEL